MTARGRALVVLLVVAVAPACAGKSVDTGRTPPNDAATDGAADAGPRIKDVCTFLGKVSEPTGHPYDYSCKMLIDDPDCGGGSYLQSCGCWHYLCKTPP